MNEGVQVKHAAENHNRANLKLAPHDTGVPEDNMFDKQLIHMHQQRHQDLLREAKEARLARQALANEQPQNQETALNIVRRLLVML